MQTSTSTSVASIGASRKSSLVKISGAMGIAGSFISLGVFLMALCSFNAALMLAILPVLLGGIGMVIGITGAVLHKYEGETETQPIAALFTCATALIVGAFELHIYMTWPH